MFKKLRWIVAVSCLVVSLGTGAEASQVENPLFAYTHLTPSPFTLPAGRIILGTDVAFGVTDFLQVGTRLINDFFKIYNANAKLSLLDYKQFAMGLTLGVQTYNLHDINSSNPDLQVTSWQPGAVTAFELLPYVALFVGGNLNMTQTTLNRDGLRTSGYAQGAVINTDLSWAYNPHKDRVGNVLSGGLSYDFTYKLFGMGVSHHWKGFHVGLHYYPNATENKVLPILSGGAVVDL